MIQFIYSESSIFLYMLHIYRHMGIIDGVKYSLKIVTNHAITSYHIQLKMANQYLKIGVVKYGLKSMLFNYITKIIEYKICRFCQKFTRADKPGNTNIN